MNIIIPLGGKGERFKNNGYTQPKPLIKIFDKCMIEYVLDNLNLNKNDHVFIFYNYKLNNFDFSDFIQKKYPFITLVKIGDTKGAVQTLYEGLCKINDDECDNSFLHNKCLILDCDTFYTKDIIHFFKNADSNTVFYTKNYDERPIYSYIKMGGTTIIDIKEKEKISNNANTGAYGFDDIGTLTKYCKHVLDNNITFNNEPYISCVISEMIKTGIVFKGHLLDESSVVSLGTPVDVERFVASKANEMKSNDDNDVTKTKTKSAFLLDLDGTLVLTDDIYFQVWSEILSNYNITLTDDLFETFIRGNNDYYVLNTLLNASCVSLNELSSLKDTLFIQNIHKIKLVPGVLDFLKTVKGKGNTVIVTNCNRVVADAIIKYTGLFEYIDCSITNDDCRYAKPNPEPYLKAIEKCGLKNSDCVIFEDSKTGILSAKSVNPKILVCIETNYDQKTLKEYGADLCIKDFLNFDYEILNKNCVQIDNNVKLKGGFIADVVKINYNSTDCILKYESHQTNDLSRMAKRLDLYNREYYFYKNILPYTQIRTPKFIDMYGENNVTGIILENLFNRGFQVNLNLNGNIDLTLKIVDNMAKMHSEFWGKNLKMMFPELKKSDDPAFCPFFTDFINEKYPAFKNKWFRILNEKQKRLSDDIFSDFSDVQKRFSCGNNLTFIHGDIKSPNIFYDTKNNNEPYFIDWQHCAIGKGVQDLVFFIIESFDDPLSVFTIAKYYYYAKLKEYGVNCTIYTFDEYQRDIFDSICYIPFFTSIWFGTTPDDELIDKNFPYFFINKMFKLLENETRI